MTYTNSELLATTHILSSVDKQRRFILQQASAKIACAACGTPVSEVEAHGTGKLDDYPTDVEPDDRAFICPHCKTQLHWILPFVGAPFWMTERAYQGASRKG